MKLRSRHDMLLFTLFARTLNNMGLCDYMYATTKEVNYVESAVVIVVSRDNVKAYDV